jgi:hypothetical protein
MALAGLGLESQAASAAERRPAIDVAFVESLITQPEHLQRMIDRRRGLIVLTYNVDSPADDYEGVTEGERLCGAKLERRLKQLVPEVVDSWKNHDVESCHQARASAECSFGFAYEYTTFTHLTFADDGKGGWWLEAIAFLDAGLRSDESQRTQDRWVRRTMKRLRQLGCDGAAQASEQGSKASRR